MAGNGQERRGQSRGKPARPAVWDAAGSGREQAQLHPAASNAALTCPPVPTSPLHPTTSPPPRRSLAQLSPCARRVYPVRV